MDHAYNGHSQGTSNQLTPKRMDKDHDKKVKYIYKRRRDAERKAKAKP
jgi:hypothetical protein